MIKFKNVSKSYGEKTVLHDLNFAIGSGEFFVIVGTSGSGKTTTLKMINRLIEPTSGEIIVDEKPIKDYDLRDLRLNTGYVLQEGALFPNLTVYENIEIIPEMKGWSKEKRRNAIVKYMDMVGLDPEIYLKRYPNELSGGEQQRVGILRAIVANPKILLMDESFSALDPIIRNQLQDLIKKIHEELRITTVFVTHVMDEAIKLADKICIMSNGEIVQIDTSQNIKDNPANEFVQRFFNEGALDE